MVSKMKKNNLVDVIGSKSQRNVYSLTGLGKQLAVKINKYVKNIK